MAKAKSAKRKTAAKTKMGGAWRDVLPSPDMQREMKREVLLRAAMAAFNRRGLAQTSLEEIAHSLGVTKAALYYYFPTKSALVAACFDRAMSVANESLAAAKREGKNGRERVVLMMHRYLRATVGESTEPLLLTEQHSLTPVDRDRVLKERDSLERELRDLVKEGIADGSIVPCDPKLAVFVLLGAIHWVAKWFTPKGAWTEAQVAVAVTEMIERMLSTSPVQRLSESVAALAVTE